ncbi:MAG TPA: ATP-dependent DNA helicase RecG [Methylibium sp.]|uniref:ATP-dependent DNA helicase RecG n=1 Tax=Methylibium sp. TaxID=2067992 RepID=UPI002DB61CA9|nr:ATP-dependent DNA helicase RecG [Methylibium sp.]HEU4458492.1 ATP-dependent DNA helicase RecG [Methylibium sp.]
MTSAIRPAAGTPDAKPAAKLSGPQRALHKLGLLRDLDLALHLPLRYEDETRIVAIGALREGESAQVEGVVRASRIEQRARRQFVAHLDDGSGELVLRFLHFYPSHAKSLAPGARVRARGEVRGGFLGREMVHPAFRVVDEGAPLAAAWTPVYPATAALPQPYLRKAVAAALARAIERGALAELLPPEALPPGLPTLVDALRLLHEPPAGFDARALDDRRHPAWQRLKFDELLAQQLSQLEARRARAQLGAPRFAATPGPLHRGLLAALPFTLTQAQRRVEAEIAADLAKPQPMHRLLQGDVGSGKTVVAALAACRAIDAGWQCALMAPTEILAEQHFRKLVGWLEPLGIGIAWLAGSRKGRARQAMLEQAASGAAQLVVGTHAVIEEGVAFARLGLAVIDEQHRFGVAQRLALRGKRAASALEPHLLMMSATPIPRTLAMSYLADLDVSTIDALPPGRTPVVTKLFADAKRALVIERIREAVGQGRQVYWVCPLVEESEHVELRDAIATHAQLADALPSAMVGLLHGRMPAAEKAAVMSLFTGGAMSVLVATTVIEVGVDVPNASLMVVEHAERFGLAQLHQLRGRVGRGTVASVCVLLYAAPLSAAGKERLRAMAETTDGFEIARRDLAIRGPGEFMGARQSGEALLRFADLEADAALLERARALAPTLWAERPDAARAWIDRWVGGKADYLKA